VFILFQILGSPNEFHFVHRALPHARSKRSVPHTRRLKVDPLVSGKKNSIFTQSHAYAPKVDTALLNPATYRVEIKGAIPEEKEWIYQRHPWSLFMFYIEFTSLLTNRWREGLITLSWTKYCRMYLRHIWWIWGYCLFIWKPSKCMFINCPITYCYSSPICFGHLCDHHQRVW